MSERRRYDDLTAWQKAMDLVAEVYGVTRGWPKEELFGLTSHVRKAAISIPSNIAEGHGRYGPKEFLHHLSIAHGSLGETETQLRIAHRLDDVDDDDVTDLLPRCAEVGRLLQGLMRSLR